MKLYDEESMGGLRELFEERILDWAGVVKRPMFGTPGYTVGGKMFASLMDGTVTVKLAPAPFATFAKQHKAKPFVYVMPNGEERTMTGWLRIPYNDEGDLEGLLPAVKVAYEAVKAGAGAAKPAKTAKKPVKAAAGPKTKAAASAKAARKATAIRRPR